MDNGQICSHENKPIGPWKREVCGVVSVAVRGDGGSSLSGLVPIVLYFFTVKFISLMNVTSGCMGTSLNLSSSRTGVFPSLIFF